MQGPQTTSISNSSFVAGRDTNVNTYNNYGSPNPLPDPLPTLRKHAALGALYDSAERPDPPKCHPETREAILTRIDGWSRDRSSGAKPILWLTGAAGAGKSAIAQTMIEDWKAKHHIIPNFFFWRTSPKRNHKRHLIPTIAFQLAQMLPSIKLNVWEAVMDGSIFEKSLKAQVESLIVNPLMTVSANFKAGGLVIVIDGLDECCADLPRDEDHPGQHYEDQQHEILDAIVSACHKAPFLRVLIASRPERQIRTSFSEDPLESMSLLISLIDEPNADADIALYLNCKFAEIRKRHPGISPSWPSQHQIDQLVEKSSGQFIYPATVVKYIARRRQYPVTSLEEILALRSRSDNRKEHPLADLDALYTLVIRCVSAESVAIARIVMGYMCHISPNHLDIFCNIQPGAYPLFLEKFLFLGEGELYSHLTDLHSVLSIPNHEVAASVAIRFMHATLSEYLTDPTRSEECHISRQETYNQCLVYALRHAAIEQPVCNEGCPPNPYTPIGVPVGTALMIEGSIPSSESMEGTWELVKDVFGEYSRTDISFPLQTRADVYDQTVESPKPFFLRLDQRCRLAIASYLLRCNNPEIEPSVTQRDSIDRRLNDIIYWIKTDAKVAAPYASLVAENDQGKKPSGSKGAKGVLRGLKKLLSGKQR